VNAESSQPESGKGRIRTRVEEKLRPLTLPNFITLFRMAIIPFVVIAIMEHDFTLALWTFILAGATDSFDGWLARRLGMTSIIGAYLDPIADKLLLTTVYIALTVPLGQAVVIPLWLAILALFRDFLIMIVAMALYVVEDIRRFPPSILGKLTTLTHVLTIGVVLLANIRELPTYVPQACFYVSFILVVVSGFNYIYRIGKMLETKRQGEDLASIE